MHHEAESFGCNICGKGGGQTDLIRGMKKGYFHQTMDSKLTFLRFRVYVSGSSLLALTAYTFAFLMAFGLTDCYNYEGTDNIRHTHRCFAHDACAPP